MSSDKLQAAITQTCGAIQYSIASDRHLAKYQSMLVNHLQYLLELQRASLAYVDAGKIVWQKE